MPRVDITPMTMLIDGLGTEEAGRLASKAVTMGAVAATIATSEELAPSLLLTIDFPGSGNNRAAPSLTSLLQFVAEVEDVPLEELVERAKGR